MPKDIAPHLRILAWVTAAALGGLSGLIIFALQTVPRGTPFLPILIYTIIALASGAAAVMICMFLERGGFTDSVINPFYREPKKPPVDPKDIDCAT